MSINITSRAKIDGNWVSGTAALVLPPHTIESDYFCPSAQVRPGQAGGESHQLE